MPIAECRVEDAEAMFKLTSEQLKKYRDPSGTLYVMLVEELLHDVLHDLAVIKRRLDIPNNVVSASGDRIVELLELLTFGRLRTQKEFKEICDLLSEISALDYQALREFWAVQYTPKQIVQALNSRHPDFMRVETFPAAIHNLLRISRSRKPEIPVSSPCATA